ncbi:helix-turn-helix domain-containing protein [Nonomuraea typhae]|uniref:helix-turn-helix domain-containing protein n=1 Tax=Nonomuraea typhae TaxID=2603600 RepID=UPI0012F8D1F3|nr:helix-turn-helix transcriptional regulator [Nonomuraea typhae]
MRHRLLAAELRRLRAEARLTGPVVAKALSMSPAKFSRLESANVKPSPDDTRAILTYYGVPEDRQAGYLALVRQAHELNWWDDHVKALPPGYVEFVGLEHEARTMISWESSVMPGLLQTRAHMDAINSTGRDYFAMPPSWVRVRNQVRLTRQGLLTGPDPLEFVAVIDEVVIHRAISLLRTIGSADLVREQLNHLVVMAQSPNVTLRVFKLWDPYPVLAASALVQLKFAAIGDVPGLTHPDVTYIEAVTGGSVTDDEETNYNTERILQFFLQKSLDAHQSIRLIQRIADQNGD